MSEQPKPRQTITEAEAWEIIARCEAGTATKALARELGVSRHTIQDLLMGRTAKLRAKGILVKGAR